MYNIQGEMVLQFMCKRQVVIYKAYEQAAAFSIRSFVITKVTVTYVPVFASKQRAEVLLYIRNSAPRDFPKVL